MKIVSWNVNGIRSILGKGFSEWLKAVDADVVCLQETKISENDVVKLIPSFAGYDTYWHSAERPGYSSVAMFTKCRPLRVHRGIGIPEFDREGRVIALEFENMIIVNVYVPNIQTNFERKPYRMAWDQVFRTHLKRLDKRKPVVVCGDFNVAYEEIDVGLPDVSTFPGCSANERENFRQLLESGFVDTFRRRHPTDRRYSWWAYADDARLENRGVRFDYALCSSVLESKVCKAWIATEVLGSDHCPVGIEFEKGLVNAESIRLPISTGGQIGFGI